MILNLIFKIQLTKGRTSKSFKSMVNDFSQEMSSIIIVAQIIQ